MGIVIPKRLENHLRKEDKWHTCVTMLKGRVEQFLSASPEFFPDYTGHGIDHINEVLTAADKLIVDDAFREDEEKDADSGILEPMDVAYLVCAILVHDLGMFLHQDGVRKLTVGPLCTRKITGSGDVPWRKVWQEYTDRTRQYSAERMHRHFGKLMTISGSSVDKETMDDDDKRIIGEFLRQNHGRLAHEIVLHGMPGSEDIDLFQGTDLSESERDMIGLLARSHTMSIRDTESYLKSQFEEGPMPDNTPVFFLMSVLRIADLLDAGDHRAPVLMMEHQNIHVPISEEEWAWNQRITRSKCRWNLKQKNRHIYAEPRSSIEYVQLDKWLKWVQAELDLCWSILAEQYPNGYRLTIHRVTSRIYQTAYRKTMNEKFVTREVKVTANPEVTRLLIAPLYGNDPSYGVRELLQNAVDACVERKYKEKGDYKGLVTIRIDPWTDPETGKDLGVFTIEDNGIGMNEHVLLNYYLSAGASYSSSDEWKQEYTAGGRSQVARTGRFGVGFLAAFLLGDRIEVVTQHKNDELGYAFSYTNQPKPLNITRTVREQGAGTTITIRLKEGVWEKLEKGNGYQWFSWYAFDDPEVRYFFNGGQRWHWGISLSRDTTNNPRWLNLKTKDFEGYLWDPRRRTKRNAEFYCNGIRVYKTDADDTLDQVGLQVYYPDVSLNDPGLKMDIDLARSKLQTFPEKQNLMKQVLHYHIARLLLTRWEEEKDYCHNFTAGFMLRQHDYWGRIPFLLTPKGFTLNYASVLPTMGIRQCVILCCNSADVRSAVEVAYQFVIGDVPVVIFLDGSYQNGLSSRESTDFVSAVLNREVGLINSRAIHYSITSSMANIWTRRAIFALTDRYPDIKFGMTEEPSVGIYCYERVHSREEFLTCSVPRMPICLEKYDVAQFPIAMHLVLNDKDRYIAEYGDPNLLFPQVLQELLGPNEEHPDRDMWIPFAMDKRREKFPEAFKELQPYFEYIQRNE